MFVECCLHKIWGRGIFDATSKQAIRKVFFMFSTNSHKFFLPWTFPGIWYSIVISQPCSHLWSLILPDYLKVSLGSKDWPTERFRTAETKCSAIWEEVENLTTVSHHCLISSLAKLKACNEPQVPPLPNVHYPSKTSGLKHLAGKTTRSPLSSFYLLKNQQQVSYGGISLPPSLSPCRSFYGRTKDQRNRVAKLCFQV